MKSHILSLIALALLAAATEKVFKPRGGKVELHLPICEIDPRGVLQKLDHGDTRNAHYKATDIVVTKFKPTPLKDPWSQLMLYNKKEIHDDKKENMNEVSVAKIRLELPFDGDNITGDGLNMLNPPESDLLCFWERYDDKTFYTCELKSEHEEKEVNTWSRRQKLFVERWYGNIDWVTLNKSEPLLVSQWDVSLGGVSAVLRRWNVWGQKSEQGSRMMHVMVETEKKGSTEKWQRINHALVAQGIKICDKDADERAQELRSWL